MADAGSVTVEDYLAALPEAARRSLEIVRRAIVRAIPSAVESIAYEMPAFAVDGKVVLHVAAWKHHYSLYFASESIAAKFENELSPYTVKKGTISFPLSQSVPEKLIERIVRFRASEVLTR